MSSVLIQKCLNTKLKDRMLLKKPIKNSDLSLYKLYILSKIKKSGLCTYMHYSDSQTKTTFFNEQLMKSFALLL